MSQSVVGVPEGTLFESLFVCSELRFPSPFALIIGSLLAAGYH